MRDMCAISSDARPHPNPLPRGEGTAVAKAVIDGRLISRWPLSLCHRTGIVSRFLLGEISPKYSHIEPPEHCQSDCTFLPRSGNHYSLSPGERDGVRADFLQTNLTLGALGERGH